ncbi:hypothetical protein KSX_60180 [Ktedonospora formicarum]|uniref:DUF2182 domain-containing protein n=2 Tax=Ktedonospora formicarum TaxID=2778364 RepID=A0A8J3MWR4_9CHLR|nr:hypothetical protein KSX_60180 [Ktedonospora formicarum]
MGMSLSAFLPYWSLMMAAMMLPALSPVLSVQLEALAERGYNFATLIVRLGGFLLGYLLLWSLSALPVYLLSLLGEMLAHSAPALGVLVGVALLVLVGLYQLAPLAGRFLRHCNPTLFQEPQHDFSLGCPVELSRGRSVIKGGFRHGLHCMGACGPLMLVMVVVGLMNLPWMLLLTLLIFLEKTWDQGQRLALAVGPALLLFALLAACYPTLMPGFSF